MVPLYRFLFNAKLWLVILILVAGITMIKLTVRDVPVISQAEKITKDTIAPLQGGVMQVSKAVDDFINGFTSYQKTRTENKNLKKQVAGLETELNRYKEFEIKNIQLRDLLDFKQANAGKYEMVTASVISRDPSNWLRRITIDRGSADGLKKDMPVVTQDGLIGKILQVSKHTSDVILILDTTGSGVGGKVQLTRTFGVVEGVADDFNYLRMIHLPRDAAIRENQTIVTSGLGSVYPKDIPIGRVIKIQAESNGILKYALIKPYADFDRLEDVFVVKSVAPNMYETPQGGQ